ncbi:T9SS type A sorting domain-containing protein [Prevotella intermedia]|uniref:T9SS type A sorting domain-containing protein n=1 Tax=Prevotella intermedia TaxID=28131 RepID=UPI0021D1456E|nr:T9SS type A sorting domain-containing protein [Prevotella intermedia]
MRKKGLTHFYRTVPEKVSIYDLAGSKVFESASSQDRYDISSLPKGVYIVAAQVNGQTIKAKVYKKRGI